MAENRMTQVDIDEIDRRVSNAFLALRGHTFERDVPWIDHPITQSKQPHIDEILTPMVKVMKAELVKIATEANGGANG
jgi:hypothetical protein